MRFSLNSKLIIFFVIFAIAGMVMISTFGYQRAFRQEVEAASNDMHKTCYSIAETYGSRLGSTMIALDDIKTPVSILADYLESEVWLITSQGTVWFTSENPDKINSIQIDEFDITSLGGKTYSIGDFYGQFNSRTLSVYAPITSNYSVRGYVFMHTPISVIEEEVNRQLGTVYVVYLMTIILFVIFVILLVWIPNARVKKLSIAAAEYVNGNFEKKLEYNTGDEIGSLSASIAYMAHQLNTLEEDQRKFISNVSHDFRSPLTSLKGYIQAMADGTIPPEMQSKYFDICLFETNRLTKLSESIIELNKYAAKGGVMLDVTSFDINDIIKQTVRSFEQRCIEKNIMFNLVLTGDELMVSADMSRIEQVMHNLVDNALKFSDMDSSIDIETTVRNEKVYVSVKDHGIGIPKESLNKIFDRFYKTDISRGKDKRGSGLGLSIVKDIITSHDENITVVSTVDAGTEFTFSLPLAN